MIIKKIITESGKSTMEVNGEQVEVETNVNKAINALQGNGRKHIIISKTEDSPEDEEVSTLSEVLDAIYRANMPIWQRNLLRLQKNNGRAEGAGLNFNFINLLVIGFGGVGKTSIIRQ